MTLPSGYLTVRHGSHGPFIDGLPIRNGGAFHGKLLVITRWLKKHHQDATGFLFTPHFIPIFSRLNHPN
jgi:hypothetical protein